MPHNNINGNHTKCSAGGLPTKPGGRMLADLKSRGMLQETLV